MSLCAFTTAYAAESYSFTIVKNATATNGSEQIWKGKKSEYATVTVKSAFSPSSYTTYKVYNYDECISKAKEIKNTVNKSGDIQYNSSAQGKDFWVNLRGLDARGTAPNYSTVKGVWVPAK